MTGRLLSLLRWLKAQTKRFVPSSALPFAVVGFCGLVFSLWVLDHDEHARQAQELAEIKQRASADVSALRARAEAALREANVQHARQVRELESQQNRLWRQAGDLQERFAALQKEEHAKLEQASTLPTSVLASQVARGLGLTQPEADHSGSPASGSARGPERLAADAGPQNSSLPAPAQPTGASFTGLDEDALRKVNTALIELNSCREQRDLMGQQIANCNQQVATGAAVASQQAASIQKLNEAVEAKDRILERRDAEHHEEIKAIRGTRLARLGRTLEHVLIGVAIGIGVAIR